MDVEAQFVRMTTGLVRIYQRTAPNWVRRQCLYSPCCSDYMILSLQKYGLFRGGTKGLLRILRCRRPYGGSDWP
jgi:putative membrane protein insertion efficiency factor